MFLQLVFVFVQFSRSNGNIFKNPFFSRRQYPRLKRQAVWSRNSCANTSVCRKKSANRLSKLMEKYYTIIKSHRAERNQGKGKSLCSVFKMKITLFTVPFFLHKVIAPNVIINKVLHDYIATYMEKTVKTIERNIYCQSTFQYFTWSAFNVYYL